MDGLTLFGLIAVSLMLVFYALEDRGAWGRAISVEIGGFSVFIDGAVSHDHDGGAGLESALARLGIRNFNPKLRKASECLRALVTPEACLPR